MAVVDHKIFIKMGMSTDCLRGTRSSHASVILSIINKTRVKRVLLPKTAFVCIVLPREKKISKISVQMRLKKVLTS